MIIQKINHAPNFSARAMFINKHKEDASEPALSTKTRRILAKEPELKQERAFGIFREGFFEFSERTEYNEDSLDELKLAICDKNGKPITRKVTIHYKRVNSGQMVENYGAIKDPTEFYREISLIAKKLKKSLGSKKPKAAVKALLEQARKLGYGIVRKS